MPEYISNFCARHPFVESILTRYPPTVGVPSVVSGQYISIPVIKATSAGLGVNHDIVVSFFTNTLEVDTRLSGFESETAQQTASGLITTLIIV